MSALGGVSVGRAGSDASIPTMIIVAEDHRLAEELAIKEEEIVAQRKNLEKIHEGVDPLMAREKDLSHKQREIATELLEKADQMKELIEELHAEMEQIKMESHHRAKPRILIRSQLCPETSLRIRETVLVVKETLRGQLTAALEQGEVVLKGLQASLGGEEQQTGEGEIEPESGQDHGKKD